MRVQTIPLTYGYNFDQVIGSIVLREDVVDLLKTGKELILCTSLKDGPEGREVVGITLLPK